MRASVAALAVLAPGAAIAQTAAQSAAPQQSDAGDRGVASKDATDIDDILVTGSNIRGNKSLVTSLTTIGRDDFERSGFLDVGQALRSLPNNFGGGLNPETSAAAGSFDKANFNTTFAASANLRGLGSGATLTLLNGNRLAPAGQGLTVDLSLIPTAAIERVEVLADGASATYGTDAVAGVVNVITRKSYDGIETRARYGGAQGGLQTFGGSALAGGTIGPFNGVMSVEYFSQDGLDASQRSQSSDLVKPFSIVPSQRKLSVMASGTYDLTDRFQITADGYYTRNHGVASYGTPGYLTTEQLNVQQYSGNLSLKSSIGRSWEFSLSGNISRLLQYIPQIYTAGGVETPVETRREFYVRSVDAVATGDLLPLPGGPLKVSVGGSYRGEGLESKTSPASAASRSVGSVHGEAEIPIVSSGMSVPMVRSLIISLAGRWDDYSDVGSIFVPKIAGLWAFNSDLALKASYSRSFRAPSFFEAATNYAAVYLDVVDNVPGGITRALLLDGTGRALKPERSRNFNIGLEYTPHAITGMSLSLGYYNVHYKDRIAMPDPTYVSLADIRNAPPGVVSRSPTVGEVTQLANGAYYQATFGPPMDPAAVGAVVDIRWENLSETRVAGFEGKLAYQTAVGRSNLGGSVSVNYIDKFADFVVAGGAANARVGTIFSPPHWRARSQVEWSRGIVGASIFWNYVGPSRDNRVFDASGPLDAPISDWNTVDASLTFHLSRNRADGKDTRIILSATNLFDKAPPLVAPQPGGAYPTRWDPTNASIVGRFLSVELVKKW